MSSELVLVVCAANVCRSPLAEFLLNRDLEGVAGVRVESAGTLAQPGEAVCSRVAAWREGERWEAAAAVHRSRRAERELLESAALILVSSRDVRSDVVLAAPEVRGHTYTLREAAHLGDGFDLKGQSTHVGLIARYAAHLDRARVVRGTVSVRSRRWARARRADGPDIVDGHGRGRCAHQGALREVLEASTAVATQLGGGPSRP